MNTININNESYVSCDDIMEKSPIFSKGIRNSRTLIKKKRILVILFIYMLD